jgi:hypothetical protein
MIYCYLIDVTGDEYSCLVERFDMMNKSCEDLEIVKKNILNLNPFLCDWSFFDFIGEMWYKSLRYG